MRRVIKHQTINQVIPYSVPLFVFQVMQPDSIWNRSADPTVSNPEVKHFAFAHQVYHYHCIYAFNDDMNLLHQQH